jgi:2-keto-3-deoxy-L-rhamnonate aldolase RhmA
VKNLKQRIRQGESLIGAFVNLGSSLTTELVGAAGFDFVVIDLEHGSGTEANVLPQLQALEHTGCAGVIRVESHARQRAHRVLDLGAHGIMFPRVNSAEEARGCAAAMRYPPLGVRGVASMNRACNFGASFREYVDRSVDSLLGVFQIETAEAVKNVEAIAAVDGADVLFIGPLDLTQSLGILGQFEHPDFVAAVEKTAEAARKHGKSTGVLMPKRENFEHFFELGFRFLASGSDGAMIANAARNLAQGMVEARRLCQERAGATKAQGV